VLLSCPDGCKLDRNLSTQWRVQTEMHVVRKDDAWSDRRPDGMARRSDGWNRGQMGLRTADRESKSSIFYVVQSLLRVL
jgi:hypothetical protein